MTLALNQNILFQSIFSIIQINLVELKTKKAKIAEIKTNVLKIVKKKIDVFDRASELYNVQLEKYFNESNELLGA